MRWPWLLLAALVAAAILANWRVFANPGRLGGLNRFPHTYLPADQVTGDPHTVLLWTGSLERAPASVPHADGLAWPAYWHPDPRVVPADAEGRPLLFPVIIAADGRPRTPPLPGHPRGLSPQALMESRRYHTEEGRALLDTFAGR